MPIKVTISQTETPQDGTGTWWEIVAPRLDQSNKYASIDYVGHCAQNFLGSGALPVVKEVPEGVSVKFKGNYDNFVCLPNMIEWFANPRYLVG